MLKVKSNAEVTADAGVNIVEHEGKWAVRGVYALGWLWGFDTEESAKSVAEYLTETSQRAYRWGEIDAVEGAEG